MLLALDVGNTNILAGIYRNEDLIHWWRMSTRREKTADEYGMLLRELLNYEGKSFGDISAVIICSVVPPLDSALKQMGRKYFRIDPLMVGEGIDTGVVLRYDSPDQVGADRIVNAAAAFRKYGGPAIVVDFGTATTFDAISAQGDYLGGAISPGIGISTEALFRHAAKLPRIDLITPDRAIGRNTVASMQSGIIFGYAGQVDAMVARFRRELGGESVAVATGGLAELIVPHTGSVQHIDPLLTLDGLRLIYQLNGAPVRGR